MQAIINGVDYGAVENIVVLTEKDTIKPAFATVALVFKTSYNYKLVIKSTKVIGHIENFSNFVS